MTTGTDGTSVCGTSKSRPIAWLIGIFREGRHNYSKMLTFSNVPVDARGGTGPPTVWGVAFMTPRVGDSSQKNQAEF